MTAVALPSADLAGPLTRAEAIALGDCEQRIERGLKTFIEVGQSLAAISEHRLYRATHETFEAYASERWGISRRHGYQLMESAAAVSSIEHTGLPLPTKESQARELSKVPAEERADVWAEAVERTDGKPTAAVVRQVAAERAEPDEPLALDRELVLATLPRSEAEAVGISKLATWLGMHPERPMRPLVQLLQELHTAGEVGRVQGPNVLAWWAKSPAPAGDAPAEPACEACNGEIDPDGVKAGYRRCEDCDSDGEHVEREPGGPCAGCNPEPELVAGQDYRTDPAERIAAAAEVAPEFVRPADPEPVTPPLGSPATWTPEQHAANDREIERQKTIEAAERAAKSLVFEVRSMVTTILSGLACNASGLLVGLADIDECRAALDRLEAGVMA
jgi:hypothetical protein